MSNVIPIRESETERRWAAYVVARERAEQSRDYRDGLAAGRAWAEFLKAFEGRA